MILNPSVPLTPGSVSPKMVSPDVDYPGQEPGDFDQKDQIFSYDENYFSTIPPSFAASLMCCTKIFTTLFISPRP